MHEATVQGRISSDRRARRGVDIERAIEMNASALAFIGTAIGYFAHPYWLALPGLVTAFLFQHALQGCCPPVPVLRRMGFRISYEIERECQALKAVRGDYAAVARAADKVGAALQATDKKGRRVSLPRGRCIYLLHGSGIGTAKAGG